MECAMATVQIKSEMPNFVGQVVPAPESIVVNVEFDIKEELLISCVQKRPVLYDYTHKEYSKCYLRENAWQEIAAEVGVPACQCQKRWKIIRDKLLRELKNDKRRRHGERGCRRRGWNLRPLLDFLLPFLTSRTSTGKLPVTTIEQHQSSMSNDATKESIIQEDIYSDIDYDTELRSTGTPTMTMEEETTSSQLSSTPSTSSPSKPLPRVEDVANNTEVGRRKQQSEVLQLLRTVVEAVQKCTQELPPAPSEPASGFGREIEEELQALCPKKRCLAKARILQVIYDVRYGSE